MATKFINLNNLATFLAKLKTLFVAKELEEQQHAENFVERDLHRWLRLLEQLKEDINQPIKYPASLAVETREIEWKTSIRISQLEPGNINNEYYVLVAGEKGAGRW